MSGASVAVNPAELAAVMERLKGLGLLKLVDVLDMSAALVESQTHRRIRDEKSYPDSGFAWPAWSPDYAATRHAGHSLLMNEGHLDDSITRVLFPGEAEVGTNLVYAGVHQATRTFLGISRENFDEIEDLITAYLSGKLEGASS